MKETKDIMERQLNKIFKILERYDEHEYPEIVQCLNAFLGDTNPKDLNRYLLLADILKDLDVSKKLPGLVVSLIVSIYEKSISEDKNVNAMNNLGSFYYNGRSSGRANYKLALEYYSMADEAGEFLASENIGYMYYLGLGVEKNYETAYKYFAKAAIGGRYEATYMIGDMYRYGQYVSTNPKMVFYCYEKAIGLILEDNEVKNKCIGSVYYRMGDAFYEGIGTEVNLINALDCYLRAENGLYRQIIGGDIYNNDKIDYVIGRQQEIREKLKKEGVIPTK